MSSGRYTSHKQTALYLAYLKKINLGLRKMYCSVKSEVGVEGKDGKDT